MKTRFRWLVPLNAIMLCLVLAITGCDNGNLFGGLHDRGDAGDVDSLNADAAIALRERDYLAALALYERVLAQQPNNAQALYGAAAASIGSAGLNVGALLANISNQTTTSSVTDLADFIAQSREVISQAGSSNPNSLLRGIDTVRLEAALDLAICRLRKIASGNADGRISPNNVSLLINLGTLFILRAVVKPINVGYLDILNVNGEYDVYVEDLDATYCNGVSLDSANFDSRAEQEAFIKGIAYDITYAYSCFAKVVLLRGLIGTELLVQITQDIGDAATELMTAGDIPAECVALFAPEITASNFDENDDVFTVDPSPCE